MRRSSSRSVLLSALLGLPAIAAAPTPEATLERREAAPASPTPRRNALEAGVFGGAFFPATNHELYDSTQSFHAPYRELGPKAGLRVGWFPLRFLGVEGEAGYAPQENQRGERNHIFDGRAHAVIQIPWRVAPFLLAGGGFLGVEGARGGDLDGALHWGGGVKVFASDWMHLRFDGRHVVSGAAGRGAGNTSHFEATAGVGFVLFGDRDRAPPVVAAAPERAEPAPPRPVAAAAPEEAEPAPPPAAESDLPLDDAPAGEPAAPEVVSSRRAPLVEAAAPVRFAFDSAAVPQKFLDTLRAVVELMRAHPKLDVVVVGHADAIGADAYNLALSRRRAEAVAGELRSGGVPEARIRVRGEGEGVPVAPNDTPEGRAKNRRAELTVVERREGDPAPRKADAAR